MTNDVVTRTYQAIDLRQKAGLIAEQWSPRVVAELNDYQFKVARIEGDASHRAARRHEHGERRRRAHGAE